MFLGAEHCTPGGFVSRRTSRRRALEVLARLGGGLDPEAACGSLGAAGQQIVEIARALSRQPRLLILDEPTAALTAAEVERLFACVRRLAAAGTGIIFISHRLAEVEAICDTILVLRNGRRVGSWSTSGRLDEARILELMTGDSAARLATHTRAAPGEPVLTVRDLRDGTILRGVGLELRRGEILGLSGLQGQGQEELLEVLAGLRRPTGGDILHQGQAVRARIPRDMIRRGICFVPNDRHRQGLFMRQCVGENLAFVQVALDRSPWRLRRTALREFAERIIKRLRIKTTGPAQPVSGLSGGNQQKIVIGKWLGSEPEVLLLSDPTKGVDIRARSEIYATLDGLAAHGSAVLVFASDTQELLQHCDRILVMYEGRVVDSLAGEAMCEDRIMAASFGRAA
jgi:ABC-type sugar transport system ATPase subunit